LREICKERFAEEPGCTAVRGADALPRLIRISSLDSDLRCTNMRCAEMQIIPEPLSETRKPSRFFARLSSPSFALQPQPGNIPHSQKATGQGACTQGAIHAPSELSNGFSRLIHPHSFLPAPRLGPDRLAFWPSAPFLDSREERLPPNLKHASPASTLLPSQSFVMHRIRVPGSQLSRDASANVVLISHLSQAAKPPRVAKMPISILNHHPEY
jgi:hypothetical protein